MSKSNQVRTGVTLIEVVASIFICGLLFSVVIAGFSRHRHQLENSQITLIAVKELDLLVAQWYQKGGPFPVGETGTLTTNLPLRWSLSSTETDAILSEFSVQKCRLSAWHEGSEVCSIELLAPFIDQAQSDDIP